MRKKLIPVILLSLLLTAGAVFVQPAYAITQVELRTQFAEALNYELPPVTTRFEGDITRRQALQTAIDTIGFSKELQLFETLSMIPELEIEDSLAELTRRIIPRIDSRFAAQGEEPLTEEDAKALASWVQFSSKNVMLTARFTHPTGTELGILRKNAGKPGVINEGDIQHRPLFAVTLKLDPKQYCGRIATTEALGLGKKAPLSQIAAETYGCIAAVNGGYFAMDVYSPIGILKNESVLLKDRVWPKRSGICWNEAGEILFVPGSEAAKLRNTGVTGCYSQALQAGPLLLQNAEKCKLTEDINIKILNQRHPRTVIGNDGEKLLITVIDGRDALHSVGTTIEETKNVCRMLGMKDALNLDGGGSSELIWLGSIVNFPSESRGERPLPYAIVFRQNEKEIGQ